MTILKKFAEGVCYLELNRPEKRNALNKQMVTEIIGFLNKTTESKDFRVLVLSGKDGFFSSGADLEWMQSGANQSYDENIDDAQLFNSLFQTLANYPKPVIARVDKGAYAGAIGLIACADIAISAPDAVFAFREVQLGLIPATVAPYIIKKAGLAVTKQLMLTGSQFTGDDAFRFNIIQELHAVNQIGPKTRELATKLAKNSPSAMIQTKILLNTLANSVVDINDETKQMCAQAIASARVSNDGKEGVSAYFEKRKPIWNDKQ